MGTFDNEQPQVYLAQCLKKKETKQTAIKQGTIVVNNIDWHYAIGTYKVEAGALVRDMLATAGNGNAGLVFEVTLSRYGDLDMIPDDAVDCVLSCFQST